MLLGSAEKEMETETEGRSQPSRDQPRNLPATPFRKINPVLLGVVRGWCGVRVGSEGKRNAADRMGQQPGSCSAPPPGAASREKWGGAAWRVPSPLGVRDRNGTGLRLAGKASPSLQGILAEQGQQGILLRKPSHKTKQNQNFIVPSEGLMPGNEWSPCPLPLGDKQNSAG